MLNATSAAQGLASTSFAAQHADAQTSKTQTDDGFSFWDLLDIVNPLQHIPGVNLLYRELTGDTIKTPSALAGGALFGGVTGFAGALATAIFTEITGDTPQGHVMALFDEPSPALDAAKAADAYARAAALAKG